MATKVRSKRPRLSPRAIAMEHCREGTTPGGLERRYIDEYIGCGLFTLVDWSKGDFLIQYQGILLSEEEALEKNEATYQYYFTSKGKRMCIDATDTQCLAKYANDEKKGNAYVKLLEVDNTPCLCIFACRDISAGEEIRYNYGVKSLPWRYTQNEENPHQLVEQSAPVKPCFVCHSPQKSQKWKGLVCIVCKCAWHESCYLAMEKHSRSCSAYHLTTKNVNDEGESIPTDGADTEDEGRDVANEAEERGDTHDVGEKRDGREAEGSDVVMSGPLLNMASIQNMKNMKSFQPVVLLYKALAVDQECKDLLVSKDTSSETEIRNEGGSIPTDGANTEDEGRDVVNETEERGDTHDVGEKRDGREAEGSDEGESIPTDGAGTEDEGRDVVIEAEERGDTHDVGEKRDGREAEGSDEGESIPTDGAGTEDEGRDVVIEAEERGDTHDVGEKRDGREAEGSDNEEFVSTLPPFSLLECANIDITEMVHHLENQPFSSPLKDFGDQEYMPTTEYDGCNDNDTAANNEDSDNNTATNDDDNWPPLPPPSLLDLTAYEATSDSEDDDWPPPPPPPPPELDVCTNFETDGDGHWPPLPHPFQLDLNQNESNMEGKDNYDGEDSDDDHDGDDCDEHDFAPPSPSTSQSTFAARNEATSEDKDNYDGEDGDDDHDGDDYDEYDFAPPSPSTSQSTFAARNEATSDECSKAHKTAYPHVTLPVYTTNNGSRSYDKFQCCFVSSKLLKTKMARHLKTHANTETAVADALNEKNKEKRAQKLEALRLMGNFHYNVEVLKKGVGDLIVVRRSHHAKVAEDYLPCLKCYGFFEISELWRHVSQCKVINRPVVIGEATEMDFDEEKDTTLTAKCRMLLNGALHGKNSLFVSHDFQDLRREVINAMREDDIKRVVEGDELTLMFGTSLLERLGSMRKHVISQRMRQLARLLIEFKKDYREMSLMNLMDPSLFDDVVHCVRSICGNSGQKTIAGVKMMDSPSYGLHIGHTLVKCCMLKRGRAIRLKDQSMKEEAVSFQELLEGQDWTSKVSSPALQSLKERRLNSAEELPSTSDLRKLNSWTIQKFHEAQHKLEETQNEVTWNELSQATFVLVTTFNKRRSGEVGRMSLDSFTKRPKWHELRNQEMENALSSMELKIADRFDMVQLPGKRGRRVPLLLKPEWVTAMDSLVKLREECDVKSQFFFGVPGKSSPINSWKVIRDMAVEAGCEKPELISTTRMRKYTATVLQLLSLEEGELEWVSNHLGHNIDIHRLSYRLHESTIECTKIAKLLMAIESGTISNYSGCTLDDLDVNDIDISLENGEDGLSESEESDGQSEAIPEVPQGRLQKHGRAKDGKSKRRTPWVEESDEEDSANQDLQEAPQKKLQKKLCVKRGKSRSRRPWVEESDEEDSANQDLQEAPQKKPQKKQCVKRGKSRSKRPWVEENDEEDSANQEMAARKKGKRARWSAEEIKILRTCFGKEFSNNNLPSFAKINRVMEKYPILKQRNPASIKSRFQYLLKQKCKM